MTPFMRALAYAAIAVCGAALLGACSSTALLNRIIPQSGYNIHSDIPYGSHPRQKLDIYVPDNLSANAPVIVFFYGGSWQNGSKSDYRFLGQAFSSKGYITAIADYRLYPEIRFPAFLEDGAQALVWVHRNIRRYGGDAEKLFVAGHSAGAYIAVMLGVQSPYTTSIPPTWIKGVIGIAGPYDFLPFTDPNIKDIFSREKDTATQPIRWVKPGLPPMLLATGDEDTDVSPQNTLRMARALNEQQVSVTTPVYPGVGHIGIILSLADGFRSKTPLLNDIDQFISTILAKEKP